MHLLTDQMNKAMVDFNKAVSINPGFPVAYAQKLFTDYRKQSNKGLLIRLLFFPNHFSACYRVLGVLLPSGMLENKYSRDYMDL